MPFNIQWIKGHILQAIANWWSFLTSHTSLLASVYSTTEQTRWTKTWDVIMAVLCCGLQKRLKRSIRWAWKGNVFHTLVCPRLMHTIKPIALPRGHGQPKDKRPTEAMRGKTIRLFIEALGPSSPAMAACSSLKASDVPARHRHGLGKLSITMSYRNNNKIDTDALFRNAPGYWMLLPTASTVTWVFTHLLTE